MTRVSAAGKGAAANVERPPAARDSPVMRPLWVALAPAPRKRVAPVGGELRERLCRTRKRYGAGNEMSFCCPVLFCYSKVNESASVGSRPSDVAETAASLSQ